MAPEMLDGVVGPWLLVDGFLLSENERSGREVFGFLRAFLVETNLLEAVLSALQSEPYLGNNFVPECPTSHTVFAGEIPWSSRFAGDANGEDDLGPYRVQIRRDWRESGPEVELLAHTYSFESKDSGTNPAKGYSTLSAVLARSHDLRLRPGTLDLVQLNGQTVGVSRAAPTGFKGHVLYVRRDVLAKNANGRGLVQVFWRERRTRDDWERDNIRARAVFDEHAHIWRNISLVQPLD